MKTPSPHSREQWQAHLAAWQSSGKTQTAYCKTHDLAPHVFRYWKKRLAPMPAAPAALVPVTVVDDPAPAVTQQSARTPVHPIPSAITVHIDNRYRIDLLPGFDPATLQHVLAVLRG